MIIRKEPFYDNETGKNAYVRSTDGGETWCVTLGYMLNRKPRGAGVDPTLCGLQEQDAVCRAKAWVKGSRLADVRMGRVA